MVRNAVAKMVPEDGGEESGVGERKSNQQLRRRSLGLVGTQKQKKNTRTKK